MISISGITVEFSGQELFSNLSFVINERDRIGLVGKNGVGKSTLMKVINGDMTPTSGQIALEDGRKIGYLPQEIKSHSLKPIYQEVLSVFEEVNRLEKELEQITKELEERTDYESDSYMQLVTSLTEKHERLSYLDNSKKEANVEKILKGLGFTSADFDRPFSEFSGGWQMRVELAKLLLVMPDLLLLDEPTNHLDIESIIWLEGFFKEYPGAIMMVSHDRMFLDNITNRTVEIVFGKIYDYKVPYTKYFQLREERLEQQKAAYDNQQKHIAQQEKFIERFRAKNTKAKQVQSKLKQLDKLERVEFDELDNQAISFSFPPAPRSGDLVIGAEDVSKKYDDHLVFENVNFKIRRGERVAFVGKNGEGKSTLVKLIEGSEEHGGELTIGHNVEIGYYAQVQEKTLNNEDTVYDTIEKEATTDEWRSISKIRGLLGAFLFGKDDVDKKVKVLSGGEKSRLAMAKLLLKPCNLLILDEPTNHLDISAKEVLKTALLNYTGTLILVSHDRDFLQGLTSKTYEFGNKQVKERLGSIDEFLQSHQLANFREFETEKIKPTNQKQQQNNSGNKQEYEQKKQEEKTIRKAQSDLEKCEKKITKLEQDIKTLEKEMAQPTFYDDSEKADESIAKHNSLKNDLDKAMWQWEELQKVLEGA